MPNFLTTAEAATQLKLSQQAVRALCRNGRLPGAIKDPKKGSWLIPQRAIEDWYSANTHALGESSSGDTIQVGNVIKSNVAMGRGAQVIISEGSSNVMLEKLFDQVYKRIDSRPEDPDVDRREISETVQKIQTEVVKTDQANVNKLERWLKTLALMAPDIFEVTAATLANPITGLGTVIRKVAEKARLESGTSS